MKNNRLQYIVRALCQALAASMLFLWGPACANGELQVADLGECHLDSGKTIKDCKLAYRVLGTLNADKSNVLIFPTWYGGSTADLVTYGYIGPEKMANSDQYYIVALEAFGNGLSSSPSNSTGQHGENFPVISLRDMVSAQHRLLTQVLHIGHVNTVMGVSMGGMQVFEWITTFPDFMDHAVPIEGTPWPTAYDLMLWTAWVDAIDTDAGDPDSRKRTISLLAALDGLTLWTPAYFNRMVEASGFEAFFDGFTPDMDDLDLADRRTQTVAALGHDISRPFQHFDSQAGQLIRAKTLIVVFETDHMVNPGPSLQLAQMIGAETLMIGGDCGHMTPNPDCAQAKVTAAIHSFLAGSLTPSVVD